MKDRILLTITIYLVFTSCSTSNIDQAHKQRSYDKQLKKYLIQYKIRRKTKYKTTKEHL